MKNKFIKKALSVITAAAMTISLMNGIPFSGSDFSITASAADPTPVILDITDFDYSVTTYETGWYYRKRNVLTDGTVINGTLTIDSGYELTIQRRNCRRYIQRYCDERRW